MKKEECRGCLHYNKSALDQPCSNCALLFSGMPFMYYEEAPKEKLKEEVEDSTHNHYYKDVARLAWVDVYRILSLYNVTDPCIQHAIKKLLVPGKRGGSKDMLQDVQEAIDSLYRWKEMRKEDVIQ